MALQYVYGSSGFGKSTYIYQEIIQESMKYPEKNYIIVVPEQYTMETQKKLVMSHPNKGILNIDVVSFERLAYKVFEEVGGENRAVLDDMGKNLILRNVLEHQKKHLTYFGKSIQKTGFVTELKSVISELLQYDIWPQQLMQIEKDTTNRQLQAKLADISLVYEQFKGYLQDHYITTEEILDVLCSVITKSERIKNSEIVFDGFTGFTPIQYKLLRLLLTLCQKVSVSVTMDAAERANVREGIQNLFFMSKDMVYQLNQICDEERIAILQPIVLKDDTHTRFTDSKELAFLEKNLFRYNHKRYTQSVEHIHLFAGTNPKEEIQYAVATILRLTRQEGYRYRDIAIVTGDLQQYGILAGNILEQNQIPYFLDYKRSVTDNPFVEMLRSAIEVVEKGYTYDTVFRYLKTGLSGIARDEIDMLENYCLAVGIRGRKAWHEPWKKKSRRRADAYDYVRLEEMRSKIVRDFAELDDVLRDTNATVRDYVGALYHFIIQIQGQKRLEYLKNRTDTGREYEQLYKKVIDLFDKIVELLGTEQVSVKEFAKILDAGFEEMKVGLIPPTKDCVVVGDIERTRLDNIQILFFIGVNDGIVPKRSENKGLLSETDRSELEQMEVTLSPTARERAFVQKFYLYLILTKASKELYISYAKKDSSGKALLPSYLLRNLKVMYPKLTVTDSEQQLAHKMLQIPKTELEWSEESYMKTLGDYIVHQMYGDTVEGSVSAFEKFSMCQFAYFLQYGLHIEEREEHTFQMNDFGTILHAVIEQVSKTLQNEKKSFSLLTQEERHQLVEDSIVAITEVYGNTILKDSSRNEYLIRRMTELADRTIWAIGRQLECGTFHPDAYEMKFVLDDEVVEQKKKLEMRGKIDRIDIYEDENNIYVRIVDYKSGTSDFNLLQTYYGLKLQLILYMKAAKHIEQLRNSDSNKKIVPAGMLYFNIDNPIIDLGKDASNLLKLEEAAQKEKIEERIQDSLAMKGVVSDDIAVIRKMDDFESGKSHNIPVTLKKNGEELDERGSRTISAAQFDILEDYVTKLSNDIAKNIFHGKIAVNPFRQGNRSGCDYCPFHAVCGFSPDLNRGEYRTLKKMDTEELWEKMKKEDGSHGDEMDATTTESN